MIDKIVTANGQEKSAANAQKILLKLAEIKVSVPNIMDISGTIGQELRDHLQQQAIAHAAGQLKPQHVEAPAMATVAMDGGRIMTRADAGRGVHDQAWKETKNACLLTMSSSTSLEDPHPQLPTCFTNRTYVEKLIREMHASTPVPTPKDGEKLDNSSIPDDPSSAVSDFSLGGESSSAAVDKQDDWHPKRLVRTCLSSMACSDEFGPFVAGEAQRRGFYQAQRRAFLGDGQAWNWTLQQRHFPDFEAITDFVHPLGYLYDAAKALASSDPWPVYLRLSEDVWQGRVADVLKELRQWRELHPTLDEEGVPDHDPRAVVETAITYLENNRARMDYPRYRRAGLPISSAMIESMIKEMNYRVKGTEKFWNRPEGAEWILQVRAAILGDDDRLSEWILNRPGSYFYRRSTVTPPLATSA